MIYRIFLSKNAQLSSETRQTTSNSFISVRYGMCLNLDDIEARVQIEITKNKQLSWKLKMNLCDVKKGMLSGR